MKKCAGFECTHMNGDRCDMHGKRPDCEIRKCMYDCGNCRKTCKRRKYEANVKYGQNDANVA